MNSPWAVAALMVLTACAQQSGPKAPRESEGPVPAAPVAPSSDPKRNAPAVDTALMQSLVDQLAEAPLGTGASVTIIRDGVSSTWNAGTRWSDGPAVTNDTHFNLASVSKLLTAARIVALAHGGRLRLGSTLRDHFPGITLKGDDGIDQAANVTLQQLLTHRAGLNHHAKNLDPGLAGTTWQDPGFYEKITASWALSLRHEPGTYGYSNLGYGLLGAVIEQTETCTYAACMATYLPTVGMPNATFDATAGGSNFAHGRIQNDDGAETFNQPNWYMSRYALPFNGLWSSTSELAAFGQLLIESTQESTPLSAMTKPLPTASGHGVGAVQRTRFGARSYEHDGSGPGFLAWLIVVPEKKLVLSVATNGGGEVEAASKRFIATVERMLEAALPFPR